MDRALLRDAMIKLLSGVLIMGLLLFLPAGTLSWPQAWLLLGFSAALVLTAGLAGPRLEALIRTLTAGV